MKVFSDWHELRATPALPGRPATTYNRATSCINHRVIHTALPRRSEMIRRPANVDISKQNTDFAPWHSVDHSIAILIYDGCWNHILLNLWYDLRETWIELITWTVSFTFLQLCCRAALIRGSFCFIRARLCSQIATSDIELVNETYCPQQFKTCNLLS